MHHLRSLLVVVLLASVTVATPSVRATTAEAPRGIDATGQQDVTSELQQLVDDTPDGGVVRLERGGTYRVEGTLELLDRHELTIDGNGARIFATSSGDGDRTHLRIVGGSGLVVHDLEIGGANPHAGLDDRAYQEDQVGQHGIRLEGTTDLELARVRVVDVYGDFVYVGRRDDGRWSERVWIHDSVFARSGRQGISVTAGRDVVIERNTITDVRRATIDLEPNSPSWGAQNIHILDNQIGPGRLLFVAAHGLGPVDQIVVAGNELRGHILNMSVQPPDADRRSGFYVVDNTSDTPATRPPLRFTRVDGLVVRGNTQPMVRPGEAAVSATDVCGLSVAGNDLAPGTLPLQVTGPGTTCATAPPAEVPAAPVVAGRPIGGAVATSTTTRVGPSTETDPSEPRPAPDGDEGGVGRAVLVALGAAGVIGALLLWGSVSGARARRPTVRRRPRQSPRR